MPRPTTITDEQILEAARAVFLERGFSATAQEVAGRAGCSSGSLFKRYPTKEALFFAAMQTPAGLELEAELLRRAGQGELRLTLEWLSQHLLAYVRDSLPREMMAWSVRQEGATGCGSPLPHPPLDHPLVGRWQAVTHFLEREQTLGRLRPEVSPQVVTGALIGGLMHCTLLELMGGRRSSEGDAFAAELVDTLWKGIGLDSS